MQLAPLLILLIFCLNLASSQPPNLAYHAKCRHSSAGKYNNNEHGCENAVDGVLIARIASQSCWESLSEVKPFIQVELDAPQRVQTVVIIGRTDTPSFTTNFILSVGNQSNHILNPACGNYTISSSGAFPCDLVGKFITLQRTDISYGSLCEILIYQNQNIAVGKRLQSSSLYSIATTSKDGPIIQNDWKGLTQSQMFFMSFSDYSAFNQLQQLPFYAIDLNQTELVGVVVYTPQQNCCWERFMDYRVYVGDYPDHRRATACPGVYKGPQEVICGIPGRYVIIRPEQLQIFEVAGVAVIRGNLGKLNGQWELVGSGSNSISVNFERGVQVSDSTESSSSIQTVIDWALTSASFEFSMTGGGASMAISPSVTKTITQSIRRDYVQYQKDGCQADCDAPGQIAYIFQWKLAGQTNLGSTSLNQWSVSTCNYVCRNNATTPKCPFTQCKDSQCETCL